jgi:hypothetical protein
METRADGKQSRRLKLALVLAVVVLLRLPFLHHAVQGDDVYYLAEAQHAQIEPLHPLNFKLVFLGNPSDMRGHSHPPLNGWILGGLLAAMGDIYEARFHIVYLGFPLLAALSMWSLAGRFSAHPLWATLLFVVTPPFLINGSSFESDLPLLAFWMASIALFVARRYGWAALAMAFAALTAYQAVLLTPILWLYTWLFDRKRRAAWVVALAPVAVVLGWQVFEWAGTGAVPVLVLNGHFEKYGFQALAKKLLSAAGLTIHACWLVFPLLLPPAVLLAWRHRHEPRVRFLAGWAIIFYCGALAIFFAGSARYLLPMTAPLALLVAELRPLWLAVGFGAHLVLGLALASVNYQHWEGYRRFAMSLPRDHRTWINADWGLRYYLEAAGGMPMLREQGVRPGDLVVTSELSYPLHFSTGGGALAPVASAEIRTTLPLRLIGLDSHAGYSTSDKGLWPFGISAAPVDRVRAELVVERKPTRERLPMDAPEASSQIVSGIYPREDANTWRWMGGRAIVLLKRPPAPAKLHAVFVLHDAGPARKVTLLLDGAAVAEQTYAAPGKYVLESPPVTGEAVTIVVDKTFSVPGDSRDLGMILTEVGFVP